MTTYRGFVQRSQERVFAVPSSRLATPLGTIEYADAGNGPPVLMSHGILGSHAEGEGMVARYVGEGYRTVAPSRMGYFGSTLSASASVALQADLYALLLDELELDRTTTFGFSAGGPSAIAFALRHPDRVEALVLASSALSGAKSPPRAMKPLMRVYFNSNFLFWLTRRVTPTLFARMLGVPKGYAPTGEEWLAIDEVGESLFPLRPRVHGARFDTFIGNPWVNRAPIDEIRVPTLIIHAGDDTLAPFANAIAAAPRIPGARLVTIERGGHLFLGHEHKGPRGDHGVRRGTERVIKHSRLSAHGCREHVRLGVDLYWLPLGVRGRCVHLSGKTFEAVAAITAHRSRLDLYHSFLEVRAPEGRWRQLIRRAC
jgi:pimeloyl-ACP methyl ester carboxylesterase